MYNKPIYIRLPQHMAHPDMFMIMRRPFLYALQKFLRDSIQEVPVGERANSWRLFARIGQAEISIKIGCAGRYPLL